MVQTITTRDKKGQQRDDGHDDQVEDHQPPVCHPAQQFVLLCLGGGEGEILRRWLGTGNRRLALAKTPACVRAVGIAPSPTCKFRPHSSAIIGWVIRLIRRPGEVVGRLPGCARPTFA